MLLLLAAAVWELYTNKAAFNKLQYGQVSCGRRLAHNHSGTSTSSSNGCSSSSGSLRLCSPDPLRAPAILAKANQPLIQYQHNA